jgi:hypothetical protein
MRIFLILVLLFFGMGAQAVPPRRCGEVLKSLGFLLAEFSMKEDTADEKVASLIVHCDQINERTQIAERIRQWLDRLLHQTDPKLDEALPENSTTVEEKILALAIKDANQSFWRRMSKSRWMEGIHPEFGFKTIVATLSAPVGEARADFEKLKAEHAALKGGIWKQDRKIPIRGEAYVLEANIPRAHPFVHAFAVLTQENWRIHGGERFDEFMKFLTAAEKASEPLTYQRVLLDYAKSKDILWMIWNPADLRAVFSYPRHYRRPSYHPTVPVQDAE